MLKYEEVVKFLEPRFVVTKKPSVYAESFLNGYIIYEYLRMPTVGLTVKTSTLSKKMASRMEQAQPGCLKALREDALRNLEYSEAEMRDGVWIFSGSSLILNERRLKSIASASGCDNILLILTNEKTFAVPSQSVSIEDAERVERTIRSVCKLIDDEVMGIYTYTLKGRGKGLGMIPLYYSSFDIVKG